MFLPHLKNLIHVSSTFEQSYSRFSRKCQTIDWLCVHSIQFVQRKERKLGRKTVSCDRTLNISLYFCMLVTYFYNLAFFKMCGYILIRHYFTSRYDHCGTLVLLSQHMILFTYFNYDESHVKQATFVNTCTTGTMQDQGSKRTGIYKYALYF